MEPEKNIKDNLIAHENESIKRCMQKMDQSGRRILFVVNRYGKLRGVLTDGDIRRWILGGGDINQSVKYACNRSPKFVFEGADIAEVKNMMERFSIEAVPVINTQEKLLRIFFWDEVFGQPRAHRLLDLPVVIMAGGRGLRLEPLTRILPKPLIPVGEKTMIEIIMDHLYTKGFRKFSLIVNYKATMIKTYFSNIKTPYKVDFITEKQYGGTVKGLKLLPQNFPKTFLLTNCDILVDLDYADLIQFHKKKGNSFTIVASLQNYQIPYGILQADSKGNLLKIEEKPEYNFLINTGVYVVERDVIDFIPSKGQYDVNHLANDLIAAGKKVGIYPVSMEAYKDFGRWDLLKKIENFVMNVEEH